MFLPTISWEQASKNWSQEERIGITQFAPHRGAEFEARGKCFYSVVFPFVVKLSIPRHVPLFAYSQYTLTITRQLETELSHRGTTRQQSNNTNIGSSFPPDSLVPGLMRVAGPLWSAKRNAPFS